MWIKTIINKDGTKSYQVRWKDGRQKSKTFKRQNEAYAFKDELAGKPKAPVLATFGQLVEAACKLNALDKHDQGRLRFHVLPILEDVFLQDLNVSHQFELMEYWSEKSSERTGKRLSPKTRANIQSAIQSLMKWARNKGIIAESPFKFKKPKISTDHWGFWTPSERDRFYLETFPDDPIFADAVLFACLTGLRLSEQQALRWSDICAESGILAVKRAYDYGGRYSHRPEELDEDGNRIFPKSGKYRYQPLTPLVIEIMQRAKRRTRGSKYIFQELRDGKGHAGRVLKRYAKKAGVKAIRWHDLRHTCASGIAMGGHSMKAVKEWLGHSDEKMADRYTHLSPGYLKGVGESLVSSALTKDKDTNEINSFNGAGEGTRTLSRSNHLRVAN